jgi:probable rRNA maturation factor
MDIVSTIDVASTRTGWSRLRPTAERLARDAAGMALLHGTAASRLEWQAPVELAIILADDAKQRRLNRDHRRRDASTNVLAFRGWEPGTHVPPGAPLLLGDVVLAFETVEREAADQQKPLADHLRHLVVHGVLHLLGYDHLTQAEAAIMEPLEAAILAKLGVPDPYRDIVSLIEPEPG